MHIKTPFFLLALVTIFISSIKQPETNDRFPILLNMIHHNPGEPKFETQYTEPWVAGQVPKIEIQCALTYDHWINEVIPIRSDERWRNDRLDETCLHDTPFHRGTKPVHAPEEHSLLTNLLSEESCIKRNRKLILSVKHVNYDFKHGYPFNKNIGLGKHQQISELSGRMLWQKQSPLLHQTGYHRKWV